VLDRVRKTISRYNMLALGRHLRPHRAAGVPRVAVAVSGGPDSVCLLHVLRELAGPLGMSLSVAHFNHKLRGAASDEDERFVAAMAAKMGLALHRADGSDLSSAANLEQAAREARAAFFARLRSDDKTDLVALGHTRDDQAETVLFRLLRGSGLSGLAGILPVTAEGMIRPLLDVTRKEVETYLDQGSIEWHHDSTNLESRFARNRIRHSLMPQLAQEWNPNVGEALAQLAGLAYDEERWWNAAVERRAAKYLAERRGGVEFNAAQLASLPRAMARRLIRRAIARAKGDLRRIEFAHVEQVMELVEKTAGEGRIQLPELEVTRSFDWVRISPRRAAQPSDTVSLTIPGAYVWGTAEDKLTFELTVESHSTPCDTLKAEEICLSGLPEPLELRGWQAGDQYRPVGQRQDQTIQKLFQRNRVPSWQRLMWPIVTAGGKILWAKRFGVAAEFAAQSGTGPVLRIFERGNASK